MASSTTGEVSWTNQKENNDATNNRAAAHSRKRQVAADDTAETSASGDCFPTIVKTPNVSTSTVSRTVALVTLEEWWNGHNRATSSTEAQASVPLPVVDLRPPEQYNSRRIKPFRPTTTGEDSISAAAIVNLPLATLLSGERSCELPPRDVAFAALVPRDRYERAAVEGEPRVAIDDEVVRFFFAERSRATNQSRVPWGVSQIILDSDETWEEASARGLLFERTDESDELGGEKVPLPRLWRPDPLIHYTLVELLKGTLDALPREGSKSQVWDLGSGAGRDVCYLAEELKFHYYSATPSDSSSSRAAAFPMKFLGLDNHKGSAKCCCPLWRNRKVQDVTESVLVDLNKIEALHRHLSGLCCEAECAAAIDGNEIGPSSGGSGCDGERTTACSYCTSTEACRNEVVCLYAIRFLNRKLLKYLTEERCPLKCGTLFAMSHFCKMTAEKRWNFDHPKEKSVLERDELQNLFGQSGRWHVVKDDLIIDGDHGRTLVQFIARKL